MQIAQLRQGPAQPNYFFGSRQHEGRLHFTEGDVIYADFVRASSVKPTIFVTTLERPLILTNVKEKATALIGDFGLNNKMLFALLLGQVAPEDHLPFELPSSEEAVTRKDVAQPFSSEAPLYPYHYGLSY